VIERAANNTTAPEVRRAREQVGPARVLWGGSRVLALASALAAIPVSAAAQPAADADPPAAAAAPAAAASGVAGAEADAAAEPAADTSAVGPDAATAAEAESPTAPPPRDAGASYDLVASSRTYLQVYQRALLPGPGGATVETDLLAPAHEYVYFRADRLDTSWAEDSVGFELSGWAAVQLAGDELGSNPDGDLTVANVYHRVGPATFTLGRQVQTAGAARFVRFDGLSADLRTSSGIGGTVYGGFTALPRWSARPGYHHLGSAFDTLVESPDALPEPDRGGEWLAGGRLGYAYKSSLVVGAGVHEQRTGGELDRRNAALDLRLSPVEMLDVSGRLIADLDTTAVADASAAADLYPVEPLHVALEYRRVTPNLLLSKQSVFSVFRTERFDELGGELGFEASERLEIGAGQWVEWLGLGDLATRTQVHARIYPEESERVALQFVYGRVSEPENGYHSTRVSARWQVATPVAVVAEHYAYFYDEDINGFALSSVEALNAEYAGSLPLTFLLGGTLAHTPYAANDAQVLLRVAYDFHRMEGGS
jgi:hypothetical protein